MKNMRCFAIALSCIISWTLFSCSSNGGSRLNIKGTWSLQDIRSDKNDFDLVARNKKALKEGAQISLFEDQSYTYVSGAGDYVEGKWQLEEDKLRLLPSSGKTPLVLELEEKDKKHFLIIPKKKEGISIVYVKTAAPLASELDDPFHALNNRWRNKPGAAESEEELKARIANYLKHFALVLKAAGDRQQQVVSFAYSMGPVRIYNGAIGVVPFHLVEDHWKNSFFSEEQAEMAFRIYETALGKASYKGASSGSWIEDDYNILLAVYSELISE